MIKQTENRAGIEGLKLNVNGRRAHYLKAGGGPPVVLVHGGASDSRDWFDTITGLAHRYTFYAPDLIGFGQNERSETGYYLSDFSDFLLEFINTLQLEKPVLVGHSFGARVCLDITLQNHEKVSKLVLIDAAGFGSVTGFGSAVMTLAWAIRKLLRRPQPYPRFLTKEGEDTGWLCLDKLPDLKTPTLLIWKRLDPYLPLSIARRAEKLIPNSRLEVLPGFGHAPHQQNSEIFNRMLLNFLDGD